MTDDLEPTVTTNTKIIEDFGLHIGHAMSWPPMAGKVFGLLMQHTTGLTLKEIQFALNSSLGSVSESTRLLINNGVVERAQTPGSRRRVYRYRDDAWFWCLQHQIELTSELLELARSARLSAEVLPPNVQQRFRDMDEYYTFVTSNYAGLGAQFRQYHDMPSQARRSPRPETNPNDLRAADEKSGPINEPRILDQETGDELVLHLVNRARAKGLPLDGEDGLLSRLQKIVTESQVD